MKYETKFCLICGYTYTIVNKRSNWNKVHKQWISKL